MPPTPRSAWRDRTEITWYGVLLVIVLTLAYLAHDFDWATVWRYRTFLLIALGKSLYFTLLSIFFGMLIGTLLAQARLSDNSFLRYPAVFYIEVVRATPQLMVLLWVFFVFPEITRKTLSPELSAIVALSIIASAYLAEVIRGGIISVPRIHLESGRATGLSATSIFIWIILPQAVRNMLPALLATWITLFKTTTLVYVLGVVEFFHAATIVNQRELIPFTIYALLALVYFLCCYALSALVRRLDPKYTLAA